jgi:hypothetical protein
MVDPRVVVQVHHDEGSVRGWVVVLLVCVQRSEVGGKFIYHLEADLRVGSKF